MFICSVRASTLKFVSVAALSLVMLVSILIFSGDGIAAATGAKISYSGIREEEDRIAFLGKFGWEVKATDQQEETFVLPASFDRVLSGYNEIQRAQGLDLARYRKKKVTRFCYEVTNYPGYDGAVYATLYQYRDRIIAADIASGDPAGFIHGLEKDSSD